MKLQLYAAAGLVACVAPSGPLLGVEALRQEAHETSTLETSGGASVMSQVGAGSQLRAKVVAQIQSSFDAQQEYDIPSNMLWRILDDVGGLSKEEVAILLERTGIPFITNNEAIYERWLVSLKTFAENEEAKGHIEGKYKDGGVHRM
ncbi:hypothetical protein BESB_019470 [Besnoitia besnoiti]|uniref:Uncharacterized protein n=1 Tax=Besnoitia besnoiti TaxID=94643 RepID=A0A2A9M7X9_BESBE|nr:hypothetical protein BESB_019470 [Besnoitia besnoiti]PFH32006.1 hypothetical protein BESB_019470 [Besnoitia besnoiti]